MKLDLQKHQKVCFLDWEREAGILKGGVVGSNRLGGLLRWGFIEVISILIFHAIFWLDSSWKNKQKPRWQPLSLLFPLPMLL